MKSNEEKDHVSELPLDKLITERTTGARRPTAA